MSTQSACSKLNDITIVSHGKCIISGEHAVLRGEPALVYPVKTKSLQLEFCASDEDVTAEFDGEFASKAQLLFWSVLERGLSMTNHHLTDVRGHFRLVNSIPVGCGMGASAALCSALSQWFYQQNWIAQDNIFSFARQLEDLFHGKSSGVDIAASMSDTAMLYQVIDEVNQFTPLELGWHPVFCLSYSGLVGITSSCVEKVYSLFDNNPELAKRIDKQMLQATNDAAAALCNDYGEDEYSSDEHTSRLQKLAAAINQARICFTQWGLTPASVEQQINDLLAKGALAAKPTGSGDGGFILSLWENEAALEAVGAEIEFIRLT